MCPDHTCRLDSGRLDLDALLADPLTRMVMDSDGVSEGELMAVLEMARDARRTEIARAS